MADRVVKVTLSAQVAEYRKGMMEAAQATRTVGTEAEKLTQKKQEFEALGRGMLVAGGVMAAGVGLAVGKFAEFDQAMSNVIATGEDATANQVELREAALEAGAATVFSATESANAIEEMAKAGLNAQDILGGGLTGSLDLAAAGGLGVARSAEVMSTTLQQFQLDGQDASHVADLLAAGAGKAMGEVEDMAQALNQAGLVANQFQIPVEETVGTLSAFASAGMLGSDAGTSLRTMLLRLANPTKENAELMESLGINAYDSTGKFVGLAGLAGELETALSGMTEEQKQSNLAMIFGQDAIRGATILLEEGQAGIQEYTRMVDDQGYAAETAAKRLDNLKGDVEALSGAVDTGLIQMGESANGPGRFVIQLLTDMVDGFNELPDAGQAAVFWIGAVGGAAALAGGFFFTAIPKIAEFNTAIAGMPAGVQRASRALSALGRLGGIGLALGGVTIGVDALAEAISSALLPSADQVDARMRKAASGLGLFSAALYKEGITNVDEAGKLLAGLGAQLDEVADSTFWDQAGISGTAVTVLKEMAEIAATGDFDLFSQQFRTLADDAGLTDRQLRTLIKTSPELQDALTQQAAAVGSATDTQSLLNLAVGRFQPATDDATDSAVRNADALAELQGAAADAGGDVDKLAEQIRGFGQAELDSRAAAREFQAAIDELQASIDENGSSLDTATEKGRKNEETVDALAESVKEYAAATKIRTGSDEEAAEVLEAGRQRLIDMLEQLNITGDEAEAYADRLGLIPENIDSAVNLLGWDAAMAQARAVAEEIRNIPGSRDVVINQVVRETGAPRGEVGAAYNANGGLYDYAFAEGGFAPGIYAGTPKAIHKFAEQETLWEAYISGKPDQRERNIGIAHESLDRLGAPAQGGVNITFGNIVVPEGLSAAEIRSEMRNTVRTALRPVLEAIETGRA